MQLANYLPCHKKVYVDNSVTKDIVALQSVFDALNKKVEAICTLSYMWCFLLTDDGCLWLNDKSHGGGGQYVVDNNYKFLHDGIKNPQVQEFWNKFIELNFGSANEMEVLEFLIDMENNESQIPPTVFYNTKKLCEAYIQFHGKGN